jgi:hypothetical protein
MFQIIQYSSSAAYSENNADRAIHETVTIDVDASSYTRETLIAAVNAAIQSSVKLDAIYSFFRRITVSDPANINNGKTRIELAAKLNRAQTQQLEGAKVVIVFPDETSVGEIAKIWTGTASCFRFPNRFVELDRIISETATSITNYVIPNNTSIVLKCVLPGYDISYNHFKTTISSGSYTLANYTNQINTALDTRFGDLSNNEPIPDGAEELGVFLWNKGQKRWILRSIESEVDYHLELGGHPLIQSSDVQLHSHVFLNPELQRVWGLEE